MDRWLITFFIGAILSLFLPIVPELFYVYCFILFGLVCLLNKKVRFVSGFFWGFSWILYCGFQYNNAWEKNKIDIPQVFTSTHFVLGKVRNIPARIILAPSSKTTKNTVNYNYKFNFEVFEIDNQKLITPIIIRLNWNKTSQLINQDTLLKLKVKFKPSHGLSNQGGFNYQVWLRQKNIIATGYVVKHKDNRITDNNISLRQQLYTHSLNILPVNHLSPLLTALSFGERSAIDQGIWNVLNKTNTQHLIAISGLHLGLIATGSFLMVVFFVKRFPLSYFIRRYSTLSSVNWLLSINSKYIAVILSCSLTFYYAYLAGFSLPTVRALIMLLLFWSFRVVGIKCSLFTWLFITVFIVLILTPMSLISGSFWLSFYAVSLILLTTWRFKTTFIGDNKWVVWFKSLFWMQLYLSVFMLPIAMLFNYQISLVSIFANVIAVPLMSFTSIPLCLLAVLIMPFNETISSTLYQLALMSIEVLWYWLAFLANQPWALIDVSFSNIVIVSAVISLTGISAFLSIKKRYIAVMSVVFVFFIIRDFYNNNNEWSVVVLDVGQGLSVIVKNNNKAILYDTGASYPSGFNMVETSVLPYLKHQGIKSLDKVIISHSDNDHAGGLSILKQALNVTQVIANDPVLNGDITCNQGDSFEWQHLTFSVLWPPNNPEYVGDENDHSCVINISDGTSSVLLTGDISKRVEKLLIDNSRNTEFLNSDVIIAPHHGSKTSSSQPFIKSVAPDFVVYSTGFMNRWKMPSDIVKERYSKEGTAEFTTANDGMIEINISFKSTGSALDSNKHSMISVKSYKKDTYPFWFSQ